MELMVFFKDRFLSLIILLSTIAGLVLMNSNPGLLLALYNSSLAVMLTIATGYLVFGLVAEYQATGTVDLKSFLQSPFLPARKQGSDKLSAEKEADEI